MQWAGNNLAIPQLWPKTTLVWLHRYDWGPDGLAIVPPASTEGKAHYGIGSCFRTHGLGLSVSDSWSFCSASCSAVLAHRQAPTNAQQIAGGYLINTSLARHRDRSLKVCPKWAGLDTKCISFSFGFIGMTGVRMALPSFHLPPQKERHTTA